MNYIDRLQTSIAKLLSLRGTDDFIVERGKLDDHLLDTHDEILRLRKWERRFFYLASQPWVQFEAEFRMELPPNTDLFGYYDALTAAIDQKLNQTG